MTISRVTKWLGAIVLAGYILTLVTSHHTLNTLKVSGPIYDKIVLGKDLVADILPPPAYLIESYLVTTLALLDRMESGDAGSADRIRAHAERLKSLEKDYQARHVFWREQVLEPRLKAELVGASYQPGERFWRIVNDGFLPALLKGDMAGARRLYGELSEAYRAHRAAVDSTVAMANAENDRIIADAAGQERLNLTVTWGVGLIVLFLIVAGVAGVLFAIAAPVNRIKEAMAKLEAGAIELDIPYLARRDEIGEIARTVEIFRQNALERDRLEVVVSENRAKDHQRQRLLDQHLLRFKEAITDNLQILLNEVDELRETSQALLKAASQASGEAGNSADACSVAASGSQAVATATEELNASIREISAQAHHTSAIVGKATERTKNTDAEVTQLMDAVGKIETVVTLIRQIAQHTNLLALNATIESARAGEAGRGFAVVAAEVRALAQRSSAAAKEIKGLIADSSTKVNAGSAEVHECGKALQEIVTSVKRVTDTVGEIAAASREQNTGIAQVNQAVMQMDQVTQANAAQTEEMSATAAALADQAKQLRQLVARFKLDDEAPGAAAAAPSLPPPKPARRPPPVTARRTGGGKRRSDSAPPNGLASKGFEEF